MILLGLELLVGAHIVGKIFEYNDSIKEKKRKEISSSEQIQKCQQASVDAVSKKQEEEADHYLKTSGAVLILYPASIFCPSLKLLTLGCLSYSSIPIFRLAEKSLIKEKKLRNDVLNALIVVGCFVTRNFFVAALNVGLYNLGSKIVAKIRNRSEKMLTDVFGQQTDKAWILKDSSEIEIPLESVQVNDIVIVNTGEEIPVDGIITEGAAMVDQHILTGESVPAERGAGDQVFASTLIIKGRICVKVEKAGKETLASKLGDVLKHMADFKSRLQSRGEEWADKAALPLCCGCGLSLSVLGVSPALAILNSSPGNALRVYASLQTLNHLTLASKRGILIKDGRALEELTKVDTVIFDKTGTLTKKQPKVGAIFCYNGYGKDDVLRYAATAEQKITHPFAKAILDKAGESGLTLYEAENSEYHIGFGITACLKNKVVRTGSRRFMKTEGIAMPDKIKETESSHSANGHSLVMVALNEDLIGALEIHPRIRPEVKEVISDLRQHGIRHISVVSGDHRQPTRHLAESLGADSYFYNVLPENKADIVEQLQRKGKSVCFVGDGINDAIAMKKANVSVSLVGASSVATDMAQVILMDGTLSCLSDFFTISKELDAGLRQSLLIGAITGATNLAGVFLLDFGVITSIVLTKCFIFGIGIPHAMLPLRQIEKNPSQTSAEWGSGVKSDGWTNK
ncbi:heavy metal translocating P-type ATPase [Desulfobacterales bacterium HSG2]|nr:heavy metal translocating P-type ATPase [Desulfobacterales bacterium HSG2]